MLRLITGLAGSGKTDRINSEIKTAVEARQKGNVLLVPEQYSHEAERELCQRCGDALSLYAEVLSFTGLARKVAATVGGTAVNYLDKGGKLLCMARAVKSVAPELKAFRRAADRVEMQKMFLSAIDGLKAACISHEQLIGAAPGCSADLAEKLRELALIDEAYNALVSASGADPSDRLSRLAELIPESFLNETCHVYVDGFTDFTGAELAVLRAILASGAELTVCFTLDSVIHGSEVFAIPRASARTLLSYAKDLGVQAQVLSTESGAGTDPIRLFADNLFSYTEKVFASEGRIRLLRADSMTAECESAAAEVLRLVRSGCRWRDIAIAVRGFDGYSALLQSVFKDYDIPLFTAERLPVSSRPLPAMINLAYSITQNGWDTDDVISYIDTGLTPLTRAERDMFVHYLLIWMPGTKLWAADVPWQMHPEGYSHMLEEDDSLLLAEINRIREAIAVPLKQFARRSNAAQTAAQHASALADFLEDAGLAQRLAARSEELDASGRRTEADEYRQLWAITVNALEQVYAILGDTPMDASEFATLFTTTMSRYDVGLIPVTLDAVTAGDFDRMRRRRIKNLIILGATDSRLPAVAGETGLFSLDELDELRSTGVELGESPENELWREFMLIYNCVSLPSDTLTIFYPELDESGSATRPSILVKRAGQLFGMKPEYQSAAPAGLSARRPAFRLAAGAKREMPSQDFADAAAAAAEYFSVRAPLELTEVENAVMRLRGSITPENAAALYGKRIKISASGAEKFFSCRFAYFCRYGLKINARRQAVFAGRETGTFTHYVLQHTAEDIKAAGGFSAVNDEFISACAQSRIEEYRKNFLTGAELKSARFLYNFRRTAESILRVVLDMASELRRSDFTPAAFELDFRNAVLPDVSAAQADYDFRITGIADRVDVFQTDGKAYLRIIDYKTGSKEFSLTDIWYGMSMQMLLYLYALCSAPESTRAELSLGRDCEILPAGVMYMPAKAKYINVDPDDDEAEVTAKRAAELKRTGLILNEGGVPEAWAKTEGDDSQENLYSFLKKDKNGSYNSNYAITRGQFEQLYAHMTARLREMAEELQKGAISAGPFVKSSKSPCDVCDYSRVCMFREGENGEHSRVAEKMAPDEIWQKLAEEVDHNG